MARRERIAAFKTKEEAQQYVDRVKGPDAGYSETYILAFAECLLKNAEDPSNPKPGWMVKTETYYG